MKKETTVVIIETTETATPMEITQEELALIIKKREKNAREAKRQGYIAELNDLFARANADGFVIATNGPHPKSKAKIWGDAAGNWIKIE